MGPQSHYFLYGYFGVGNFGDDILLYAAIKNILAQDPDATFLIRNHGRVSLEQDFPGRVQCTDIEKIHHSNKPSFFKFFILLHAYWVYMGRVSILVVGGGTLIHDSPSLKSTFLLLCLCLIAKIRGRRLFGIGLGSQKLKTVRSKMVARFMARLFNRFCLRDQKSFDQFKHLTGNSSRLSLTTDLAYALPINETPHHKDKIIAVTLADYLLERINSLSRQQAITTLAHSLTGFIKKGYHIRLLSLQKEVNKIGVTGDTQFLERLQSAIPLPDRQKVEIITIEANPHSIKAAYDGVALMVGMRFHSLIFSAIKHIPFVGLADEPKIDTICDEFSMPCLAVHDWNEKELTQAIEKSLDNTINLQTLERYHALALDNFGFLSR